jgi:hypothetical protein
MPSDCESLIDFDCLITDEGKPVILYKRLDEDLRDLLWAVQHVKFNTGKRTLGLQSTSTIFGYSPKLTVRRDYCTATSMSREFPKPHSIICRQAELVSKYYKKYFPDTYVAHEQVVTEKVLPAWRIPNSVFTSGIVNKNSVLKYHHDAGNFKGVMSNMIVMKHDVEGGNLAVPEYGITLEVANNTLVIFDGQLIMHGVTPIKYLSEQSYRYSVVYYTLQQMWKCLPVEQEKQRIREVKLTREKKRLKHAAD